MLVLPFSGDSNFSYVKLLLPMNGENGGTVFKDYSWSNRTVTVVGGAQTSTTESKFGGSSGYFDGTGDYLTVPSSTDFDFTEGYQKFSIITWYKFASVPTAGNDQYLLSRYVDTNNYFEIYFTETTVTVQGKFRGILKTNETSSTLTHDNTTWHHLAVSRDQSNIRLFVDGTVVYTGTNTVEDMDTADLNIGRRATGASYFNGYLQDLLIMKNYAKYSTDFTAPSSPVATHGIDGRVRQHAQGTALNVRRLGI
jgi:hypothetical protein